MLEKLLVKSSKNEAFNCVSMLLLREEVVTGEAEKAEATPVREDRPVAALREVFRNAATEQRKIIAVLPKIMMFQK
jgi:hypothetical protein